MATWSMTNIELCTYKYYSNSMHPWNQVKQGKLVVMVSADPPVTLWFSAVVGAVHVVVKSNLLCDWTYVLQVFVLCLHAYLHFSLPFLALLWVLWVGYSRLPPISLSLCLTTHCYYFHWRLCMLIWRQKTTSNKNWFLVTIAFYVFHVKMDG